MFWENFLSLKTIYYENDYDKFVNDINNIRTSYYDYDKNLLNSECQICNTLDDLSLLHSGRFSIDINTIHYECFYHKTHYKKLYIMYSAGKNDHVILPHFPRWSYYNLLDATMLCFEDPMYYKYDKLNIGWFYGTKDESYIINSFDIIHKICSINGIKEQDIVFFGSSAGGYASLYASTYFKNTISISINPQLFLDKYEYSKNFMNITKNNLLYDDKFDRNNIYKRIKYSTSYHIIITNIYSKRDFVDHTVALASMFYIKLKYGITSCNNILFWCYIGTNIDSPHNAYESKNIFIFIKYIVELFKNNHNSIEDFGLMINELWYEILSYKYNINLLFKHYKNEYILLNIKEYKIILKLTIYWNIILKIILLVIANLIIVILDII